MTTDRIDEIIRNILDIVSGQDMEISVDRDPRSTFIDIYDMDREMRIIAVEGAGVISMCGRDAGNKFHAGAGFSSELKWMALLEDWKNNIQNAAVYPHAA